MRGESRMKPASGYAGGGVSVAIFGYDPHIAARMMVSVAVLGRDPH